MTDGKSHKTEITLEPGQVAIVLGMEREEMNRQLFASPDIDAMLDDEEADIPFNYFLAAAFLARLDQDEVFGSELVEWYDGKLRSEARHAAVEEQDDWRWTRSFPLLMISPKLSWPVRISRASSPK